MKSKYFQWSRTAQGSVCDPDSTGYHPVEDQQLIAGARRFETQALAEIYNRYSPGIYRYAYRLMGDQEMARECMSETFQRFLTALQRGNGPSEYLQAYLYRIAHNWITDIYRRKSPPSLPLDPELCTDPGDEPAQAAIEEVERQQVRAALALLTPDQRQVIVLKYLEDWKNEDIARAMNRPVGAVKALQHRAIEALRRIFVLNEGEINDTNC